MSKIIGIGLGFYDKQLCGCYGRRKNQLLLPTRKE